MSAVETDLTKIHLKQRIANVEHEAMMMAHGHLAGPSAARGRERAVKVLAAAVDAVERIKRGDRDVHLVHR